MQDLIPLVIVGAGGHGREMLDVALAVNAARPTYDVLGFLDDGTPDAPVLTRRGTPHLGPIRMLETLDAAYVIGIGYPHVRRAIDAMATDWGRTAATLVHPRAVVGGDVEFGPGTVVCALASATTNVRTGRHVHLNVAASVAHDCRLGDFVTLAPGARLSGAVTVGDGATIGTGAAVIQSLSVGEGTTVGAGAVVVRDVPAGVVAIGVPARSRVPAGIPG